MTTQLPPALANLTPKTKATAPALFPPSFQHTVETEFQRVLKLNHPDVVIDLENTWLNLYEYKISKTPPFTDFPPLRPTQPARWFRRLNHSLSLIDSLIDFFLDTLVLDEDSVGWFTTPTSVEADYQITALNHQQLQAVYSQVGYSLSSAYKQSLMSFWGILEANGKTRRAMFITERVRALQLEAQAGVEQKSLTSQQAAMLKTMLRYSHENSPTAIKKHGVYSLSLNNGNQPALGFAGTFILSEANKIDAISSDDVRLGPVLLYSPNNGLEGFASFALLNQSLAKRMNIPAQKQWFLENVPIEFSADFMHPDNASVVPLSWHCAPMSGDFLNAQFLSQITKQQSDFAHCVRTSQAQGLKSRDFLEALRKVLDPRYQFNNFLNLDWNDRYILSDSMPHWWHAMSAADKKIWLMSAKKLGNSIIELEKLTEKHLSNPLSVDQALTSDYVDSVTKRALVEKKTELGVNDIYVDVQYTPAVLAPSPPTSVAKRYSLKTIAVKKPSELDISSAYSIVVTDVNGEQISGVDEKFVRDLMLQLNTRATVEEFVRSKLQASEYAKSLREVATRLSQTQMRMGYLSTTIEEIPKAGLDWINTVINAPEATANRQVNNQKIGVKFLTINGVQLSNVMQFAPEDSTENGRVFCTLNAPDGVVFRWFPSLDSAKSEFLDNPAFARYLMLQIPIKSRPQALRSLQLDQRLKHYRFPEFFKYFPSPVPIPALVWDAIGFIDQSKNFLEENHELKIAHLIIDATANLLAAREIETDENHTAMHLALSVILLFLPPPVAIPIALGMGLYKAWNGFRAIEEENYQGAAKEFLIALDYLATAGISKLALSVETKLPMQLFGARARPIARRVGPDGEPHISVLSERLALTPLLQQEGVIAFDALTFHSIEIDNETFYIRTHANLFGHMSLYRRDPADAKWMTQAGEFALRGKDGRWVKAPYQVSGISKKTYREASHELGQLVSQWPTSVDTISAAQKTQIEKNYLTLAQSNADSFQEIIAYSEGGSNEINSLLRAGEESEDTVAFMHEFYQLDEFQGNAFRAVFVSSKSLERLQNKVGTIFSDKGVQSASVSQLSASNWAKDEYVLQHASTDTHLIFMVLDPSIPKKSMFTSFLGDHVAVAPDTPLQLMAYKHVNNAHYAYFSAPEQVPQLYVDIFTGREAAFQ